MQAESVVIGLGKTAESCVRHWQAAGERPCVMDTRSAPTAYDDFVAHYADVPVLCGGLDIARLQRAKQVVMSPGLSVHHPAIVAARAQGVQMQSDVDVFVASAQAPIIGITGTNGKSTVTTLTAALLQAHGLSVLAGANLGTPVLDLLAQPVPDVYVLELSSFQLALSGDVPLHAACLLNISADHLDWHGSYQAYVDAKHAIFRCATHRVACRDGEAASVCMPNDGCAVGFALAEPQHRSDWGLRQVADRLCIVCGDQPLVAVADLAVWGEHQWLNVMAACALAETLGVPWATMCQVLRRFSGLAHRCQRVRQLHGVCWYNDSKGTNPAATMSALRSVAAVTEGRVVVLLGGMAKGADFSALGALLLTLNAVALIYGRDAAQIQAALPAAVTHRVLADLAAVTAAAADVVQHGDAVLLSPACASWDQFAHYQQRGRCFEHLVEALL